MFLKHGCRLVWVRASARVGLSATSPSSIMTRMGEMGLYLSSSIWSRLGAQLSLPMRS